MKVFSRSALGRILFSGVETMIRACFSRCLVLTVGLGLALVVSGQSASMAYAQTQGDDRIARIPKPQGGFDLEVLVDGRPLAEF